MSWSAEQQRLLGAMGYTLFQRAAPGPATMPQPVPMPNVATSRAPARQMPTSIADSASVRVQPAGNVNKLLAALQQAALGQDVSALVEDLAALRRDPLKKRALWPQLRTLRRAH